MRRVRRYVVPARTRRGRVTRPYRGERAPGARHVIPHEPDGAQTIPRVLGAQLAHALYDTGAVPTPAWIDVLVVEDDARVSRAYTRMLDGVARIRATTTVALGLHAVDAERPEVLLVDLGLPDGTGLDVARAGRGKRPPIPTLILTGTDDRTVTAEAAKLGALLAYKPISLEALVATVQTLASERARALSSVRPELARFAAEFGVSLSPMQLHMLDRRLRGAQREDLAAEAGVAVSTVDTHLREALRRLGDPTLEGLRARFALEPSMPPPRPGRG